MLNQTRWLEGPHEFQVLSLFSKLSATNALKPSGHINGWGNYHDYHFYQLCVNVFICIYIHTIISVIRAYMFYPED